MFTTYPAGGPERCAGTFGRDPYSSDGINPLSHVPISCGQHVGIYGTGDHDALPTEPRRGYPAYWANADTSAVPETDIPGSQAEFAKDRSSYRPRLGRGRPGSWMRLAQHRAELCSYGHQVRHWGFDRANHPGRGKLNLCLAMEVPSKTPFDQTCAEAPAVRRPHGRSTAFLPA